MPELYENIYAKDFSFGKNWSKFLAGLTPERIALAERSLREILKVKDLRGKTFLDIGCGSGLFSLAAIRLGAQRVISIDVDRYSVATAQRLREQQGIPAAQWTIMQGSALDKKFLATLKRFQPDVVYSWGVLHHTGDMWRAIEQVAAIVPPKRSFAIAIYNKHTGFPSSETWLSIKRFYAHRGKFIRWCMRALYLAYFTLGMLAHGRNPVTYIKRYGKGSARGMDYWRDVEDWLGGYPYEYASGPQITTFFAERGFTKRFERLTPREGCNEFLFVKK